MAPTNDKNEKNFKLLDMKKETKSKFNIENLSLRMQKKIH